MAVAAAARASRALAVPSAPPARNGSSVPAARIGGAVFAHIKCKPGKSNYLEEWAAFMIRNTEHEQACTRYEIWRGTEPDSYYVMECFSDPNGFFLHQASPYHVALGMAMEDLDVIESIWTEWIDFAGAAHTYFPPTKDQPLPPDTSADVRGEKEKFPVREAPWWIDLRGRSSPRQCESQFNGVRRQ